jgi:uncharacterized membrane protein (UPF0127 family)
MTQRLVLQSIIATGAIVFFAMYELSGCFHQTPSGVLPTVPMQIGNKRFTIEIADTAAKRSVGLMKRDSMDADHGMIFVFPEPDTYSFWMKNTRIPLDIIFIDAGGTVRSIQQMKPYDLKSVSPPVAVKYAIELNQGAAGKAGAKVGDKITIPQSARETKE